MLFMKKSVLSPKFINKKNTLVFLLLNWHVRWTTFDIPWSRQLVRNRLHKLPTAITNKLIGETRFSHVIVKRMTTDSLRCFNPMAVKDHMKQTIVRLVWSSLFRDLSLHPHFFILNLT